MGSMRFYGFNNPMTTLSGFTLIDYVYFFSIRVKTTNGLTGQGALLGFAILFQTCFYDENM